MDQNHLLEGLLTAYRHRLTLGLRIDEGHATIMRQLLHRDSPRPDLSSLLIRGIGQHGLSEFAADLGARRSQLESAESWDTELLSDVDEALFHLGQCRVLSEAREILSRELDSPALAFALKRPPPDSNPSVPFPVPSVSQTTITVPIVRLVAQY